MRGLFLLLAVASAMTMKEHPLTRVISMLKSMQTELGDEGQKDSKMMHKQECALTKAINDNDKMITQCDAQIANSSADKDASHKAVVGAREAANTAAANIKGAKGNWMNTMKQANESAKEFQAQIEDLTSTVGGLKNALTALKGGSLLQASEVAHVKNTLSNVVQKMSPNNKGVSSIVAFVESGTQGTGEIIGTITTMKETAAEDLGATKEKASTSAKESSDLASGYQSEITAAQNQQDAAAEKGGQANADYGDAVSELEDATNCVRANTEARDEASSSLKQAKADFNNRQQARATESAGVADTIAILSEDSVRKNTRGTVGFVQMASQLQLRSPSALALLAAKLPKDEVAKVVGAVKKNIHALEAAGEQDRNKRKDCRALFNEHSESLNQAERNLSEATGRKEANDAAINNLQESIRNTGNERTDMKRNMEANTASRAESNAENHESMQAQQITANTLNAAINRMKKVFESEGNAVEGRSLLQRDQNAGGSKVISMLEKIKGEANGNIKEIVHSEEDESAAYASFMDDTTRAAEDASASIAADAIKKGAHETNLNQAKADVQLYTDDQFNSVENVQNTQKDCKFHLAEDVFNARQSGRDQEITNLNNALTTIQTMKIR